MNRRCAVPSGPAPRSAAAGAFSGDERRGPAGLLVLRDRQGAAGGEGAGRWRHPGGPAAGLAMVLAAAVQAGLLAVAMACAAVRIRFRRDAGTAAGGPGRHGRPGCQPGRLGVLVLVIPAAAAVHRSALRPEAAGVSKCASLSCAYSQGYNHPTPGSFLVGLVALAVAGLIVRAAWRRHRRR